MENEIMNNEEVIEEAVEAIDTDNSGKFILIAAGVGVAALAGRLIWKKAIKPAIEKRKAKKEAEVIEADCEDIGVDEDDVSEEI